MEINISDNTVKKLLCLLNLEYNGNSPRDNRVLLKENLRKMDDRTKLFFLRKNQGLTQAQFAEKFALYGSDISNMESGARKISLPVTKYLNDNFPTNGKRKVQNMHEGE